MINKIINKERKLSTDISPIVAKWIIYPDGFKKCIYDKIYKRLIFINQSRVLIFNKSMTKMLSLCEITSKGELGKTDLEL